MVYQKYSDVTRYTYITAEILYILFSQDDIYNSILLPRPLCKAFAVFKYKPYPVLYKLGNSLLMTIITYTLCII